MSQRAKMIEVGAAAPDATVFRAPRAPLRLADVYPGAITVLLFYPLAFSSTCTAEMCTVAEDLSGYERLGASVYGVSVDSPYVNAKFAESCGASFPFLSDFNREAAAAFGILREDLGGLRGVSERAVFVIDGDGIVRYTWLGEHPGVMPSFDAIRDAVRGIGAAA